MKRRFTAAAVLIGILLVGVLTTVITRNFVSSQAEKVVTVSSVSENDPDVPENIVLSRNESNIEVSAVLPQVSPEETEEETDLSEAGTDEPAESGAETEEVTSAGIPETTAAAETSPAAETDIPAALAEEEPEPDVSSDDTVSLQTPAGPSIAGYITEEEPVESFSDETVISGLGSSGPGDYVSISPLDTAAASEDSDNGAATPGNGNVTAVGSASETSETVKSPLEGARSDNSSSATREDLLARLTAVEEKTAGQNSSAQAAEYELNLWNYEMNYIADTLRSAMDYDSAESLLQEQLKFLKDRDLAYDSGALANRALTENDTSYITEATEKTRQRCYYLLDTYGDILN